MSDGIQEAFELDVRQPIKGYPELRWTGKRPYTSEHYYPAQLRERHGEPVAEGEYEGWINKIFWGDNKQVLGHLLREYRGKVDLIYIDPPFDSKADYKKKISLRGKTATNDSTSFEEKQYGDIWTNDEYLQFMYERLILCRELLSETGSIYVHMDEKRSHAMKLLMDEVFGPAQFQREIVWRIGWVSGYKSAGNNWIRNHDIIFYYTKSQSRVFNKPYIPYPSDYVRRDGNKPSGEGMPIEDTWNCSELDSLNSIQIMSFSSEKVGYPTQKNEALLERIIKASSNPGDLVFDCFMGSGTTQAVAMKLGRRFLGADINLGAIQTTTKRLIGVAEQLEAEVAEHEAELSVADNASAEELRQKYTGFEVYNVNNYDVFRNPVEAKNLLIQALEIQPFPDTHVFDGELDGRMVAIMPVNRIATRADLEPIVANLPWKQYEKKREDDPRTPVEAITLVCMGHEPELKAALEAQFRGYKVDVEVVDILRDRSDLEFKREAEAEVVREGSKLVIRSFFPLNLMQKLSLQEESVEDWRELTESVMIDWNYDGAVLEPVATDIPGKKELVAGIYDIPETSGTIRVKITDLLAESIEIEVE